jgi:hypothetical protein
VVAKAGEVEPAHQVLDIESGEAKGHQQFPNAIGATLDNREQKSNAFLPICSRPATGCCGTKFAVIQSP